MKEIFYCSANEELSLVERFSKSHSEREKILQQRKESMLSLARKRYDFFFSNCNLCYNSYLKNASIHLLDLLKKPKRNRTRN